jgi:hypothetical protein
LVHVEDTWKLGESWGLLETDYHPRRKNVLVQHPLTEYRVKWRQRLRPYAKDINGTKLYLPPVEIVESIWDNPKNTMKIGFNTTLPIGMYLGHILRVNNVTLVNVLVFEGYDLWL